MGTDKRARQKELRSTRLDQARQEAARSTRRRRFVRIGAVVVVVAGAVIAITVFSGTDDDKSAPATTTTTPIPPTECPPADGSAERRTEFAAPPPMCIDPTKAYTATVSTSMGDFSFPLNTGGAPTAANNFVVLSRYHFYDGLTFHRVAKDFVIQGGDPQGTGNGGPGYSFPDELPQPADYKAGTVAMANSGPDTNGSQFFVVVSDAGVKTLLDGAGGEAKYTILGNLTSGLDVVTQINSVPTGANDVPVEPVTIQSVTITES